MTADRKTYDVAHYSLEMILAIGFRVRSVRGTQFRQRAVQNLREYIVKGFVLDVDRLKNPDGRRETPRARLNRDFHEGKDELDINFLNAL